MIVSSAVVEMWLVRFISLLSSLSRLSRFACAQADRISANPASLKQASIASPTQMLPMSRMVQHNRQEASMPWGRAPKFRPADRCNDHEFVSVTALVKSENAGAVDSIGLRSIEPAELTV
jgi:hypothetical protein